MSDIELRTIGVALPTGMSNTVLLGTNATGTGSSQFVLGDSQNPVSDSYFGGVFRFDAGAGLAHTIHGMGAQGTDQIGGNLTIAGGKGTGTGAGGSLIFQTAPAAGTGSGENALTTAMTVLSTNKIGMFTTAPLRALDINSSTGDCLRLIYNDADGSAANYADFLVSSTGDLHIASPAQKTLVLDTVVYDDIVIAAMNLRGGGTPPDYVAFQNSIYAASFKNASTDIVYGSFELPHTYKEGTDLELHLHWSPSTVNTGNCVFNFAYSIAAMAGTFGAEVVRTFTQAGSGTINKHQYVSADAVIPGGGTMTIGTIIVFALSRPTGDAFSGDAFLHSVGCHYQVDTMGSRQMGVK
jgi:hypothetical protein